MTDSAYSGKRRRRRVTKPSRGSRGRFQARRELFLPDLENARGWSRYDQWLMHTLALYMAAPEVHAPLLDAEGQPVFDSFGLPKDTALVGATPFHMRTGSVWITKSMFAAGWKEVFGEGYLIEDYPDFYRGIDPNDPAQQPFLNLEERMRAQARNGHPMDMWFSRIGNAGHLIHAGRDQYMVTRDECVRIEASAAWILHIERGQRWENLTYDMVEIPRPASAPSMRGMWEGVDPKDLTAQERALSRGNLLVLQPRRPDARISKHRMFHNPRARDWADVFDQLKTMPVFDRGQIADLAYERGLVTEPADHAIDRHIVTWGRASKSRRTRYAGDGGITIYDIALVRVAPRLFSLNSTVTIKFKDSPPVVSPVVTHHAPRPEGVAFEDWCYECLYHIARLSLNTPEYEFTLDDFASVYEGLPQSWKDKYMRVEFRHSLVAQRLRLLVNPGVIERVTHGVYRLSPRTLKAFEPFWRSPDESSLCSGGSARID